MKIKHITTSIFLTFLFYHSTVISQTDTIFYNQKWKETTKSLAVFYRPFPLQQKGANSLIKDYYLDGTLQFKGWSKTDDLEGTYIGEIVWYYPNGNKKSEVNYENNKRNGPEIAYYENGEIKNKRQIVNDKIESSTSYSKAGKLLSSNSYKDGYLHNGISSCFVLYKNGKRIGKTLYFENTEIPAYTSKCSEEGCYKLNKETHYDINGSIIQENTLIEGDIENGREIEYYKPDSCGYITAIKSSKTYKDGALNGPFIRYNVNGEITYKGTYKEGRPQQGTIENNEFSLTFVTEYENGLKNGREIVLNERFSPKTKKGKIAEGVYVNGKRQTGTFVERRGYNEPIILNLINGIEEGKQQNINVARGTIMGYYHAKNGKKEGASEVFDYEGNSIVKAIYKNGKPYEGTVITNGKPRFYKNGERLRENTHIDIEEKERMDAFSKGSDKIEGTYNMGGFEMAGSIVFLDTYQFFYSLSVGSLDLITYGAYHLKNGKLKLKVPEEQKQPFVVYGRKNENLKDSVQVNYYNYNARSNPLFKVNKQWYALEELKQQGRMQQHGVDSFRIAVKKLSSMEIGIKKERNNDSSFALKSLMKMEKASEFNDFIIAYNVANKEITEFEKSTFSFNKEYEFKGKKKRPITEEEKENVLDYIIENKSFPYYIRSKKFQKIKAYSNTSNQKITNYLPLNNNKE